MDLEVAGAEELRPKESDRISVLVWNLTAIGALAKERPDELRIFALSGQMRGRIGRHGDQRIAMAFCVIRSLEDNDCVALSYPAFWSDLDGLVQLCWWVREVTTEDTEVNELVVFVLCDWTSVGAPGVDSESDTHFRMLLVAMVHKARSRL